MKWLVMTVSLAAACADEGDREKPEAPDMSELVAAYDTPTSNFDAPAATEVQTLVETKVKSLIDFDAITKAIEDSLGSLDDEGTATFAPTRNIVLEGEGFARIERICTGFGTPTPPVDKVANGFLELTAGYSEDGLDPVVFGGAVSCLEQASSTQLTVNGTLNLFIGDNVKLSEVAATPILFELRDFAFAIDGTQVVSGGFDFRVCRGTGAACVPGHIELLLHLGSGSTLIFFVDLATKAGGFRGANGVWTCDFATGECTDGKGGMVVIPAYQL